VSTPQVSDFGRRYIDPEHEGGCVSVIVSAIEPDIRVCMLCERVFVGGCAGVRCDVGRGLGDRIRLRMARAAEHEQGLVVDAKIWAIYR
jgi:hypothetical protein